MVQTFNVPPEDRFQTVTRRAAGDVVINLVETARENWSFGNGIAQCAL